VRGSACILLAPSPQWLVRRSAGSLERNGMGYVIAAYGLVIGTLAIYGYRVQARRRQLERAVRAENRSGSGT